MDILWRSLEERIACFRTRFAVPVIFSFLYFFCRDETEYLFRRVLSV